MNKYLKLIRDLLLGPKIIKTQANIIKSLHPEEVRGIYRGLLLEGFKVIKLDYKRARTWWLIVGIKGEYECHYGNIPPGELGH